VRTGSFDPEDDTHLTDLIDLHPTCRTPGADKLNGAPQPRSFGELVEAIFG